MKNHQIILFAVYFLITLGACNKNQSPEDAIRNIPADVTMLTTINVPSLMKKMDFETVKTLPFYTESAKKVSSNDALVSMIMMDPEKSGIDLTKNMYLVGWADPKGNGEFTMGTVCSVKDINAFTNMMNTGRTEKAIQKDGNWTIAESNTFISWNKQLAVILAGDNEVVNEKFARQIFTLQPANSVASNKDLNKLLGEKHDISAWMNSNALAEIRDIKFGAGSINIKAEDLKNNYIHSFVDFEKGEINAQNRFFFNKGLIKDVSLLVKDDVNTDFTSYFPDNASSVTALALDFKGIRQVMSENIMLKKMVTESLEDAGFTFDDVTKALQGDILMTSFALNGKNTGLVAMKISDKNLVNKFLNLGIRYGILEKAGTDMYRIAGAAPAGENNSPMSGNLSMNSDTRILIQKDMLILANDEAVAAKIIAGGFKDAGTNKTAMVKMMNNNLFSNMMNLSQLAPGDKTLEALKTVKEMKTSINRKGSETKMLMLDQEVNSLRAIINAMNEQYLKEKKEVKGETI